MLRLRGFKQLPDAPPPGRWAIYRRYQGDRVWAYLVSHGNEATAHQMLGDYVRDNNTRPTRWIRLVDPAGQVVRQVRLPSAPPVRLVTSDRTD